MRLALLSVSVVGWAYGNSESDALYTLRKSLSDPGKVLQSWDPTLVNPCTWFHITCNHHNRVTRLYSSLNSTDLSCIVLECVIFHCNECVILNFRRDLGNSNLSGHLVPELGKLEHLQYLYVLFPFSSFHVSPNPYMCLFDYAGSFTEITFRGLFQLSLVTSRASLAWTYITTTYQGQFLLHWGN